MRQSEKGMENLKREYERAAMDEGQVRGLRDKIEQAKLYRRRGKRTVLAKRLGLAAAAAVCAFFILPNTSPQVAAAMSRLPVLGGLVEAVTFREYRYDSAGNHADVKVPELQSGEDAAGNTPASLEEINREIQRIAEQKVAEFQQGLSEEGYQDIVIDYEIVASTPQYFTLKFIYYYASGSGAETDYYYTIDLATGNRLALGDLFREGVDYLTPISENIKEQMRRRMQADEMVVYWLDDEEVPEWNFQGIEEDVQFYVNEDDDIVICFQEGEVAPMYMGSVQFVISRQALAGLRR